MEKKKNNINYQELRIIKLQKKNPNDGVPYVASQVIFRFGANKTLREYPVTNDA